MNVKEATVNGIVGSVVAFISFQLGGLDMMLQILLWFLLLDYITGVICAALRKELSSQIGLRGIIKKLMFLVVVFVAVQVDKIIVVEGIAVAQGAVRTLVICFFISNEGISLLENAAELGVPIPSPLIDLLKKIKDKTATEFGEVVSADSVDLSNEENDPAYIEYMSSQEGETDGTD